MTRSPTPSPPVSRRTWLAVAAGTAPGGTLGCVGTTEDVAGECETTDTTEPIAIDSLPDWDEPPHDIADQERTEATWDEHYLGACIAREPSVEFEVRRTRGRSLLPVPSHGGYWVGIATTADEVRELFGSLDPAVDLDEHVLVAVQSPGSSSFRQRWGRVETIDPGVHLHGYYERPYTSTPTNTTLESVVAIERPTAGVDLARVSLTTSERIRVHFDTEVSPVEAADLDE